jgi:hypothetical protein
MPRLDSIPAIDYNSFTEQVVIRNSEGQNLLARMLTEFRHHAPDFLLWMETAVRYHDIEGLRNYVQQFNRLCRLAGAPRLIHLVSAMEDDLIERNHLPALNVIDMLCSEVGTFIDACEGFLEEWCIDQQV